MLGTALTFPSNFVLTNTIVPFSEISVFEVFNKYLLRYPTVIGLFLFITLKKGVEY
jgi:hypothetical protein